MSNFSFWIYKKNYVKLRVEIRDRPKEKRFSIKMWHDNEIDHSIRVSLYVQHIDISYPKSYMSKQIEALLFPYIIEIPHAQTYHRFRNSPVNYFRLHPYLHPKIDKQ